MTPLRYHARVSCGRWKASVAAAAALAAAPGCVAGGSSAPVVTEVPAPDGTTTPPVETEPTFRHVSTEPCPESRFECITLEVPRDHFSDADEMWEVTFAIQRAAQDAKGTFVTITGGPGSSGLAVADFYTDAMAPEITDQYDIVFLDQRGIGASEPLRCDAAATAYYRTGPDPNDPDIADQVAAAAESFVDDCVAEAGVDRSDLPFFATAQAVEDLEALRLHLGVEQLHLYGESYGTQYVQTYAAAHPNHVAALILDGVVDLTVDVLPYYFEAAEAYDDVLAAVLADCTADEACVLDAGDDALAAYDALAAELADGPVLYEFPLPDGTTEPRHFTANDLDLAAASFVGSLGDRMLFQRAVAATASGNLVPLARLAYSAIYVDPESLEVNVDPSSSDAMYFAVECQDYEFLPDAGTPRQRLDAWLDAAADAGVDELRLGSVALGDVPCLYWPAQPGDVPRPEPIVDPPYPTLVLTADTDAATPAANAMRVFSRLDDSYLVLLHGGPHVIFDWGYACVDELVSGFLATGEPPVARVTICDGEVADPYVPNAPVDADGYDDAFDAAAIVADQITASSEYVYWPADADLDVGCDFGGSIAYTATDVGADVALDACEFTDGVSVSGTGVLDDEAGTIQLELELPDGELTYENDGEIASVEGTYEGQAVAEEVDLAEIADVQTQSAQIQSGGDA